MTIIKAFVDLEFPASRISQLPLLVERLGIPKIVLGIKSISIKVESGEKRPIRREKLCCNFKEA